MAFPAICYEHRHFNDIKDGRGDVHEEGRRWAADDGAAEEARAVTGGKGDLRKKLGLAVVWRRVV